MAALAGFHRDVINCHLARVSVWPRSLIEASFQVYLLKPVDRIVAVNNCCSDMQFASVAACRVIAAVVVLVVAVQAVARGRLDGRRHTGATAQRGD